MLELGAGIVMLGQSVIMTQPICQGYTEIAYELKNKYKETMISEEIGADGSKVQYWGNLKSGTYIVVKKKDKNIGCIMEFGQRKPTY